MPRRILLYDIVSQATGESISRHRTRQAAIDNWREKFIGVPVRIYRLEGTTDRTLIVEGTWHSA